MTKQNSAIFDFSKFNKVNGVYYLSNLNNEFEELYVKTREIENRILSDKVVEFLPQTNLGFKLHSEWELRKQTAQKFNSYLENNNFKNILDLGCGNGWFTNLLANSKKDSNVVGVDINAFELEQASRIFKSNNISFLYYNIFEELTVFKNSFDLIVLNASVQYFQDFDKLFKRLKDFLKPSGEIHILDSPFYKKEEIENAKERTDSYYMSIGCENLSNFYFHHCHDDIKHFEVLYQPAKKIRKLFSYKKRSPFLWVKFVKRGQSNSVKKGFSKIALEYEELETNSSLIQYKRNIIREHLLLRLDDGKSILEINCGTGIDAVFFAEKEFLVTAADISEGMLFVLKSKVKSKGLENKIKIEKKSFLDSELYKENLFDCVFSNFGGLNCVDTNEVEEIIKNASSSIKKGGIITLVIMPKVALYEWSRIFKGKRSAFRRLKKGRVIANIKGENVTTYYHSAKKLKSLLEKDFEDILTQNIFTIGPGGNAYDFPIKCPILFNFLIKVDSFCTKSGFLKGYGDYYIISAKKR